MEGDSMQLQQQVKSNKFEPIKQGEWTVEQLSEKQKIKLYQQLLTIGQQKWDIWRRFFSGKQPLYNNLQILWRVWMVVFEFRISPIYLASYYYQILSPTVISVIHYKDSTRILMEFTNPRSVSSYADWSLDGIQGKISAVKDYDAMKRWGTKQDRQYFEFSQSEFKQESKVKEWLTKIKLLHPTSKVINKQSDNMVKQEIKKLLSNDIKFESKVKKLSIPSEPESEHSQEEKQQKRIGSKKLQKKADLQKSPIKKKSINKGRKN